MRLIVSETAPGGEVSDGGRIVKAGGEIDVPEYEAVCLKALGYAFDAPPSSLVAKRVAPRVTQHEVERVVEPEVQVVAEAGVIRAPVVEEPVVPPGEPAMVSASQPTEAPEEVAEEAQVAEPTLERRRYRRRDVRPEE